MARQVNAWRVHFNILEHKEYCRKNNIDMTTNPDILELLGSVREF